MTVAYWIIVLIISGQSVMGDIHYPTEEACKEAIVNAVGLRATCVPIYKAGKYKEPNFECPELDCTDVGGNS